MAAIVDVAFANEICAAITTTLSSESCAASIGMTQFFDPPLAPSYAPSIRMHSPIG